MDTSRVHRQPATVITPLLINAAETADGVPEGPWVTHTVQGKRTVSIATKCAISHSSNPPAKCGSDPHGVDIFSIHQKKKGSSSQVPTTLDGLHPSRIRAECGKLN